MAKSIIDFILDGAEEVKLDPMSPEEKTFQLPPVDERVEAALPAMFGPGPYSVDQRKAARERILDSIAVHIENQIAAKKRPS